MIVAASFMLAAAAGAITRVAIERRLNGAAVQALCARFPVYGS